MYTILLTLPFIGSLLAGFIGRKLGAIGAQLITTTCLCISAILAIVAFYEVALAGSPVILEYGSWLDSESLLVNWTFMFDSLTVSMLLAVLIVSSLVHIFSISYMAEDPHTQRFFAYLSMFTGFMVLLVTGDNYLVLFLGWEGIGISSYLLVGFWYTRMQANKSAIKALTVNRVGDMFLSIGFFALFWVFGNLDYATIYSLSPYMNETALTIIGVLLLLAAIGKSAQLGLHTWLPDAMEGPTPVSALIHAATLVTAGVYLLIRSSPLLEYAPTALLCITFVGAATAFFAASTGLLQNDIKRVIAYSTCSQMGYLFLAVGLSQYNVALFHLVNHAFFKAVLFLAAGGVLHSMADQQDLRRLGGLGQLLPFTYVVMLIGSLSLMAFPYLTGFYSKDLILELAYGQYEFSGHFGYWMGTITAMLTAFYSFRLISMTFFTVPNAPKGDYEHTHEQPTLVVIPYVILALLAVFFGYLAKDIFIGIGSDVFGAALFTHPNHITLVDAEFGLPTFYKLLPSVGSVIAAFTAFYLYNYNYEFLMALTSSKLGHSMYSLLNGKYYWDVIYNKVIYGTLSLGLITSKVLDKGVIEMIGPFGLTQTLYTSTSKIATLDTGVITTYALYIILGMISLTLLLFLPTMTTISSINLDMRWIFVMIVGFFYLTNFAATK